MWSKFAVALAGLAAVADAKDASTLLSAGHQAQNTALIETQARARVGAKAMAKAQWRFGSNYVPQHYGNWKFSEGQWNFGNDKRIECEACGYNMYMLIDRLGDEFTEKTVTDEMNNLCPRVQWVFKSACEYINKKHAPQIKTAIMRLTEPEDICKQLSYCAPDFYDAAQMGGMAPVGGGPQAGHGMGANQGGGGWAHNGYAVSQFGYGNQLQGGQYGVYPAPGSHPMSAHSPYSPYNFGGYDPFGYPLPHPGVPSSTPPPPTSGGEAAKRR
jgi:hypothetical protein